MSNPQSLYEGQKFTSHFTEEVTSSAGYEYPKISRDTSLSITIIIGRGLD